MNQAKNTTIIEDLYKSLIFLKLQNNSITSLQNLNTAWSELESVYHKKVCTYIS
jgi:hypothetical protein